MSARSFEIINEKWGTTYRRVSRLTCCKCGKVGETPVRAVGGDLPAQVIGKKLAAMGWHVGSTWKDDICPACVAKKKEKPVLKVVSQDVEQRVMGRDDRRIIFEKLNETYVDEATGYDAGWSDHRVASDLGVPRRWVEQVREEMFGSIGTNAEMNDFLAQMQSLHKEAQDFLSEAKRVREEVQSALKSPALASAETIADRVSKLDRLANEIRKLVVTP